MRVPDFDADAFVFRLKALVAERSSVADICRRAQINRQQFNKYLSGQNVPSLAISYRLASALGVGLDELVGRPELNSDQIPPLDMIFQKQTHVDSRSVRPGRYVELVKYGDDSDTYLFGVAQFSQTAYGGTYKRDSFASRFDGTATRQRFQGHYYEGAAKVSVFYANVIEPNTLGAMLLRKIDPYGADLIGIKTAHRFLPSHEPISAPVGLITLDGSLQSEIATLMREEVSTLKQHDLPDRLAKTAQYLETFNQLKNGRLCV